MKTGHSKIKSGHLWREAGKTGQYPLINRAMVLAMLRQFARRSKERPGFSFSRVPTRAGGSLIIADKIAVMPSRVEITASAA